VHRRPPLTQTPQSSAFACALAPTSNERLVPPIKRNSRAAPAIRITALLMCPPLLALAYACYCGALWYGMLLAYAPILGGWIGLTSRPVLDAAAQRANPRFEFSGKGFVLGSLCSFFIAFAFAPASADRTALVALFLASSLLYYALGKIGCLLLGCCRASDAPRSFMPLPMIEALWSGALAIAALLTLFGSATLRLWSFPLIAVGFLLLRIYSRNARGSRMRDALLQLDSIVLAVAASSAAIASITAH
jgi:hypothetical protein